MSTSIPETTFTTCSSTICMLQASHDRAISKGQQVKLQAKEKNQENGEDKDENEGEEKEGSSKLTTTAPNMLLRSASANAAIPQICTKCGIVPNEMLHLYGAYALDLMPSSLVDPESILDQNIAKLSLEDSFAIKRISSIPSISISLPVQSPLSDEPISSSASSVSENDLDDLDIPPNFATVLPGVYRSSFPSDKHFEYLKTLGLKTVVSLVADDYPEPNVAFMKENGIQHIQIGLPGKRDAMLNVPLDKITEAVGIILNRAHHPLLIHCNKGKHRTGCVVACIRKAQRWSLTSAIEEYREFSYPKSRITDENAIQIWDELPLLDLAHSLGSTHDNVSDQNNGTKSVKSKPTGSP